MSKSMKKMAVMVMAALMVITFMPGIAVKAFAENGKMAKKGQRLAKRVEKKTASLNSGETPSTEDVPIESVKISVVKDGVLKAEVKGKDGKEATNVTYQWQRCSNEYWDDTIEELETEFENLEGETADTLKITEEKKSRFKKYKVLVRGAKNSRKEAEITHEKVAEDENLTEDEKALNAVAAKFSGNNQLKPEFGKDNNLKEFMEGEFTKSGFTGVFLSSVDSVQKAAVPNGGSEANIASDGTLTYFYHDPTKVSESPINNMPWAKFAVEVTIKKGTATKKLTLKNVVLNWNAEKLSNALNEQILGKVNFDVIKGENSAQDSVKKDLSLIRYFGGKDSTHKNASIDWKSSDKKIISINAPQGGIDDVLYAPMIGKVARSKEDKTVTLTATINYKASVSKEAEQAVGKLKKEFKITVKGYENTEADSKELQEKLEKALKEKGLRAFGTGEAMDPTDVRGDIQFPTVRDFGVDGKFQPITIDSDNKDVAEPTYNKNGELQNNATSMKIYRPIPGKNPVDVTLTVKIKDTRNGAMASKDVKVTVKALEQQELDRAKQLMDKAIVGYYDGIKNENTDKDEITSDLHAFREVNFGEGEKLNYIYKEDDRKRNGIEPDTWKENAGEGGVGTPGYSDLDYTYFYSSNAELIQHGNLILGKKPEKDTKVNIESYLTHQVYGKYYVKYKKAGDEAAMAMFAPLYRQHASVTVTVKANPDMKAAKAVEDKINELPAADEVTIDIEKKVNEIKAAFDALTEEQKKLVSEQAKEKLEHAIIKIKDDKGAVSQLEEQIEGLPNIEDLEYEDANRVHDVRMLYESFYPSQKALVNQALVDRLNALQARIDEIKEARKPQEEAEQVGYDIADAPDVGQISYDDIEMIVKLIERYDALTQEQKTFVMDDDKQKLEELRKRVAELKAEHEAEEKSKAEAAAVEKQLKALPTESTIKLSDEDAVKAARKAYDALRNEQKKLISLDAVAMLEAAEKEISDLKEEKQAKENRAKTDKEAVDAVENKINSLPAASAIKISDEAKVKEARAAYGKLNKRQQALLKAGLEKKLSDCEKAIEELKKAKEGIDKLKAAEAQVKKAMATKLTLSGLKLKPVKKKHAIKLSWKAKGAPDGYSVVYKKDKAKKYSKAKIVKKPKYMSKKLKKGAKYVFKIRAYKNIDGKKIYGKWYKTKKVTCK